MVIQRRRHKDHVLAVAISPDGSKFASGSSDSTVRLWDVKKRKLKAILGKSNVPEGHDINRNTRNQKTIFHTQENLDKIQSLAFTSDGKTLFVGNRKEITLWNIDTNKRIKSINVQRRNNTSVYKTTVRNHLDGTTSEEPNDIKAVDESDEGFHTSNISTIALSPDDNNLAVGVSNGVILLLDNLTFEVKNKLVDHRTRILAYSHDGRTLASGSLDGTIMIWDLER